MRSTVVAWILAAVATPLMADDASRTAFGVNRARALEAIVASAHPGSTLEWATTLTLVHAGGTRERLNVGAMALRTDASGYTCLVSLEYPQTDTALEKEMERFETPASRTRNELFAAKFTSAFALTEVHHAPLPDLGITNRVRSIQFETGDALWPDATIQYAATYATTEWLGEVDWGARIRTNPIALVSRLPIAVGRADKAGDVRNDSALVDVVDANTLSIQSATTSQRITTCPAACLIDGKVLLGLWWTTKLVVAAP